MIKKHWKYLAEEGGIMKRGATEIKAERWFITRDLFIKIVSEKQWRDTKNESEVGQNARTTKVAHWDSYFDILHDPSIAMNNVRSAITLHHKPGLDYREFFIEVYAKVENTIPEYYN